MTLSGTRFVLLLTSGNFHTTLAKKVPPKCGVLLGFKNIAWAGREILTTGTDWAKKRG